VVSPRETSFISGTGLVRLRHLGETGLAGETADSRFVPGIAVAVHADHGGAAEAVGVGCLQLAGYRIFV